MAKANQKEKKATVRIPMDPLNPDIKTCTIYHNGKSYQMLRGKDIEVPIEVKRILEESGEI